ncbi:GGDEF domain-containing protein [Modestobacter roseus]|uniref:Diguanylate cyclase (GGDEF)-like protein n=1 Tax=Modestobacter roseus TaxID=1181884 RepID=A0A562IT42_9ACTN|nr:GGDEF domain-containing protein [Modestobacter roseus]MQA32632.1 diguanylate cyclase [Modestobacter roseus]TWH73724.1 diguanylate cyclase (GGDEF)-like protein [Modestobacter roseus]
MDGGTVLRGRPVRVVLLAALFLVGGAFCLAAAVRPLSPAAPTTLNAALGVTGVLLGSALWAAASRVTAVVVHAALVFLTAATALLAWQSATAVGVVGLGPMVIALGSYAAHFTSLRATRAHVSTTVALVTTGAVAATPGGFAVPWLIAMVTAVALTESQAQLSGRLRAIAATDPLTGLANRRAWQAETARTLARAHRTGAPLTLAVLDLDGFKEVNDRDGHDAGDALLRRLARTWSGRLRTSDLLGRYGGDEFVLCLPDTDLLGAAEILARLRHDAATTWSVGTAVREDGDSLTALLNRADADLYLRKRARRAPEPDVH